MKATLYHVSWVTYNYVHSDMSNDDGIGEWELREKYGSSMPDDDPPGMMCSHRSQSHISRMTLLSSPTSTSTSHNIPSYPYPHTPKPPLENLTHFISIHHHHFHPPSPRTFLSSSRGISVGSDRCWGGSGEQLKYVAS